MKELPLSQITQATQGVITRIIPRQTKQLSKLMGLGIHPGQMVQIHRVYPQFVISIGHTLVGLDDTIACLIYIALDIDS